MYIEISHIPPLVEATAAALGILGGFMALGSGTGAAIAFWAGRSSATLADWINQGLALGFTAGLWFAVRTFMVVIGNS
jgi:hypothetical protein